MFRYSLAEDRSKIAHTLYLPYRVLELLVSQHRGLKYGPGWSRTENQVECTNQSVTFTVVCTKEPLTYPLLEHYNTGTALQQQNDEDNPVSLTDNSGYSRV